MNPCTLGWYLPLLVKDVPGALQPSDDGDRRTLAGPSRVSNTGPTSTSAVGCERQTSSLATTANPKEGIEFNVSTRIDGTGATARGENGTSSPTSDVDADVRKAGVTVQRGVSRDGGTDVVDQTYQPADRETVGQGDADRLLPPPLARSSSPPRHVPQQQRSLRMRQDVRTAQTKSKSLFTGVGGVTWKDLDAKFRRDLPDDVYVGRLVYRGLVMRACPRIRMLDGIEVSEKERDKAERLLENTVDRRRPVPSSAMVGQAQQHQQHPPQRPQQRH